MACLRSISRCLVICGLMLRFSDGARFLSLGGANSTSSAVCCCWKGVCGGSTKSQYQHHVAQKKKQQGVGTISYCCENTESKKCERGKKPHEQKDLDKHLKAIPGLLNQLACSDASVKHSVGYKAPASDVGLMVGAAPMNKVLPTTALESTSVRMPIQPDLIVQTLERKRNCNAMLGRWTSTHKYDRVLRAKDDGNSFYHSLARHCGKVCDADGNCDGADRIRARVQEYVQSHPDLLSDVKDQGTGYIKTFQSPPSQLDRELHAAGILLVVKIHSYSFGDGSSIKQGTKRIHGIAPEKLAPEWELLQCADQWMPVSPHTMIWPSTCDKLTAF